jgi:hypothetical protein
MAEQSSLTGKWTVGPFIAAKHQHSVAANRAARSRRPSAEFAVDNPARHASYPHGLFCALDGSGGVSPGHHRGCKIELGGSA